MRQESETGGPNVCIFCGSGKPTLEHVYARWIRKALLKKNPEASRWLMASDVYATGPMHMRTIRKSFNEQVQGPCGPCNNGWMSVLENKAKPLLQQMFHGDRILLSELDQATVATWALKTVVMQEQSGVAGGAKSNLPPRHLADLGRLRSHPPDTVAVWLAQGEDSSVACEYYGERLAFEWPAQPLHDEMPGPKAYLSTLRIGRLIMQVFGADVDEPISAHLLPEGNFGQFVTMVWPGTDCDVSWPPIRTVAGGQANPGSPFEFFARRFFSSMEWVARKPTARLEKAEPPLVQLSPDEVAKWTQPRVRLPLPDLPNSRSPW